MRDNELNTSRLYQVVKHNDIIQKCCSRLSLAEEKMVCFLVSLIKPDDDPTEREHEFFIPEYCELFGIDPESGKNYQNIRQTLKSLRDKSVYIMDDITGTERTVAWLEKVWTNKGSGRVKVRFDEDIVPYIMGLSTVTTRFELQYIIQMQSKYSIKLYQIAKSWCKLGYKKYKYEDLRRMLGINPTEFKRFYDFKVWVLEKSKNEINGLTDIVFDYNIVKPKRGVIYIELNVKKKKLYQTIQNIA